ncbi:MAG: peptidylprolyl isomerase [Sulfuritalea sp.]|nr:peptidylprolyl isomerase [Sulfuritalea sp.]
MKLNSGWSALAGIAVVTCLSSSTAIAQEANSGAAAQNPATTVVLPLYATVNGKPVTQAEFHSAYATFLRQKYYHGQVPQEQLVQARKEVSDKLIERMLLLEEIERRGIQGDSAEVEKQIQVYEQRYASSPNWQKNREALLPGLRQQLTQQSRLSRLEQGVRDVPAPTPDEVKAFYAARPELFTEPEKVRLHTILLAVDPSSAQPVWDAAMREAEAIVKRIRGGGDFSEQARMASKDASAEQGGDMGYLHRGMLPESLQAKVDQFKVGEVSEPIQMLQGVGVFRLDDRIAPKLQDFSRVAERAADLLHRERKEKAWQELVTKLRSAAKIVIHEPTTPATEK